MNIVKYEIILLEYLTRLQGLVYDLAALILNSKNLRYLCTSGLGSVGFPTCCKVQATNYRNVQIPAKILLYFS